MRPTLFMTLFSGDIGSPRTPGVAIATREQLGSLWTWIWMGLACALLLISGAVRFWEDRTFRAIQIQTINPLFPLKSVDETVGRWEAKESRESVLDPEIARVAGSSDSLIRTYVDKKTGVSVVVLVLYGRAGPVTAHTPEVCYTSQGYDQLETFDLDLPGRDQGTSRFRSLVFTKKGGREGSQQEVFYAFRSEGRWSPVVEGRWKALETSPPVFKIMVQRRLADRERRNVNNPCIQFLTEMLPALERRIRAAEQARVNPLAPAP